MLDLPSLETLELQCSFGQITVRWHAVCTECDCGEIQWRLLSSIAIRDTNGSILLCSWYVFREMFLLLDVHMSLSGTEWNRIWCLDHGELLKFHVSAVISHTHTHTHTHTHKTHTNTHTHVLSVNINLRSVRSAMCQPTIQFSVSRSPLQHSVAERKVQQTAVFESVRFVRTSEKILRTCQTLDERRVE